MKMIRAFGYAITGIGMGIRLGRNLRIQLCIAVLVMSAGAVMGLTMLEWVILLGCSGGVLGLELINTAIEKLCDVVHPSFHPGIKLVKDIAAGAVLIAAIASAVIGCIVFIPHLYFLLKS